jgi:hypothetical protein
MYLTRRINMTATSSTEVKVIGEIPVKGANIIYQHEDIVALELELGGDMFSVAAFGDGSTPSIILTHDKFSAPMDQHQRRDFTKVSLPDLKGYKVWSCDRDGEILKICLMRHYF